MPDEVGDGRLKLVVFAYDGLPVGEVPELIERVYANKGAAGSALRALRNHLVFVAADEHAADGMRRRMRSRQALQRLKAPDRLVDLAEHQQEKIRDLEVRSEQTHNRRFTRLTNGFLKKLSYHKGPRKNNFLQTAVVSQ